MALLTRTVTRETLATVFDQGRDRRVMVSVDPVGSVVVLRLKGTRRSYSLPASYLYVHAVKKSMTPERPARTKGRRPANVSRGQL